MIRAVIGGTFDWVRSWVEFWVLRLRLRYVLFTMNFRLVRLRRKIDSLKAGQ